MSLGLANPDIRTEIISEWAKLRKVKFNEEKTELVNSKRKTQHIWYRSARRKAPPQTPESLFKTTASGNSTLVTFELK